MYYLVSSYYLISKPLVSSEEKSEAPPSPTLSHPHFTSSSQFAPELPHYSQVSLKIKSIKKKMKLSIIRSIIKQSLHHYLTWLHFNFGERQVWLFFLLIIFLFVFLLISRRYFGERDGKG